MIELNLMKAQPEHTEVFRRAMRSLCQMEDIYISGAPERIQRIMEFVNPLERMYLEAVLYSGRARLTSSEVLRYSQGYDAGIYGTLNIHKVA